MAIVFVCSNLSCGKRFKAADKLAGKRVRCPACKTVQVVPSADPDPVELDPERLAQKKTVTFACANPSCEKKLTAPQDSVGKTIQCPICQTLQVVPSSDSADLDEAGLSLHDLEELANGQEIPTDTTGQAKARQDAFLSGCGRAVVYGLGSFPTCFRMILVASGFNLVAFLVLASIALVSGNSQGGAVFALIVMNLGNWLLGAFFLRFHMNVVLSSVEGTDLPPAMPQFDLRELFLMALKGLGVSVVYILPVVTIPLLPLGWLALAYCNDERAFDLLWALRSAVKRPGQLLLLWLILAGYVLLGIVALVGLALAGGMVVGPATAWCAEYWGVGLAIIVWIAMLIPVVLLLLATVLMFACILFRCVGMLGRHNPDLLRSLPEDRNPAKAMCFVIVGVVLSVAANFLLAPPAARSLGGAVGAVVRRLGPPGAEWKHWAVVRDLLEKIDAMLEQGKRGEAESMLAKIEEQYPKEKLPRSKRDTYEKFRRRRRIKRVPVHDPVQERIDQIAILVKKGDMDRADEELTKLRQDHSAETLARYQTEIEHLSKSIQDWREEVREKLPSWIAEARSTVKAAGAPLAVTNKRILEAPKKKSLRDAQTQLDRLEKPGVQKMLSDGQQEEVRQLREELEEENRSWDDLQSGIRRFEGHLSKREEEAFQAAEKELKRLETKYPKETELIDHLRKRLDQARITIERRTRIRQLNDIGRRLRKKDVSWAELAGALDEIAGLKTDDPDVVSEINKLKDDIFPKLTANIEGLLQEPTFELISKHKEMLLRNPMLTPAVRLTLEKYSGKPVRLPIKRHVALALHKEALRRVRGTEKWYKSRKPLVELALKCTEGLMTRRPPARDVGSAASLAASLATKADLSVANDPRYKRAKAYRSIVWDPPGWHSVPVVELLTKRFVSHCPVVKMPETGQMNVGANFHPCTEVKNKNDAAHKAFRDRHFNAFRAYAAENFPAAKPVELAKQVGPVAYECIRAVTVRKGGGWVMVGIIGDRSVVFWFGGRDIRPFHQTLNNVGMVDIEGKIATPAPRKKEGD